MIAVKSDLTGSIFCKSSEISNQFSTYAHRIQYKRKLFKQATLKQYKDES